MRYTDIVWDFDGTLFDSYPNCLRAFMEMLKSYGCDEDEEEVREKMVITIRHALDAYSEKYYLDRAAMRRRYKEMEGFHPEIVAPYPGIPEILRELRESGRRNHLFTNRNQDAVRYLDAYDLTQYFDGLVTSEQLAEMKPSPYGMNLIIKQFQAKPEEVLMVGDRDVDLVSAKAAGTGGCFYNTNRIEVPECADFVVERIEDLMNYV